MISGRDTLHPDIKSILFSELEISARCVDLGADIAAEYADKAPLVLVTLSGAYMFASELLKRVYPPPLGLHVDFLRASSYGAATESSGTVTLQEGASKMSCQGRHVVVVEDIVDTGHTLQRLRRHLLNSGAASVAAVSLLDKAARREVSVDVEFVGFDCPDEFVVGYGLDFNEEYRSLPYIGVLRNAVAQGTQ